MILSVSQKRAWLKLALSENIGPVSFRDLLTYFGSAEKALTHIGEFASRKKIKIADDKYIDAQLDMVAKNGVHIVCSCEPDYPFLLKQLAQLQCGMHV